MKHDAYQAVLAAATRAAGGDSERARAWLHLEKLAAFGDCTAAQLVADGRVEDVLAYIDSMEAGPAG